jgi:hypothetical protein
VASFSIFILQALWRLVHPLRRFGPVYDVESAFEITASGIYIIKLILNSMIVEAPCRRQALWQYSTAFVALLINLGLGIGNLLYCKSFPKKHATGDFVDLLYEVTFSETALGRLLLAIELYILIVSSMVFSFYSTSTPLPLRDRRASSFCGLRVSKLDAGLGLGGEDAANPIGSSGPAVQRTQSWLGWNGNPPEKQFNSSYENGRRATSEEAAERGVTSSPSEKRVPFAVPDDIQLSGVDSFTTDQITRGISEDFSSPTTRLPPDSVYSNGRPFTPVAAAVTTSPISPTVDLDGFMTRKRDRPSRRSKQPSDNSVASSHVSGYEILLREQFQLERSIAALKTTMFEEGRSGERRMDESQDTALDLSEKSRPRESSTTAYGPTSASNRSDFSLSVFPEPPEVQGVTEDVSRIAPRSSLVSALTPTFDIGRRRFPVSTAGIDDVSVLGLGGMESAGTHYDVTSFIGGVPSVFFITPDVCG